MKIILYSDLHLEFGTDFMPPKDSLADLMILAGDIIVLNDFEPLDKFLKGWNKPVLYVTGNHEHYTKKPMRQTNGKFGNIEKCIGRLTIDYPNVRFLDDEAVTIDGINFFGGTMWTDFNKENPIDMMNAYRGMSDFRLIKNGNENLTPQDTVEFHKEYVKKLIAWFETPMEGKRVVISHHAPVYKKDSQYSNSSIKSAFNSLDMVPIIEKYQPTLWVYGHTHEPDFQKIGDTVILSNPRGYPLRQPNIRKAECEGFDENGIFIMI